MTALLILSLITYGSAKAQNLPPGSYKDTCRSVQVLGGTLTAQCQKADGSWKTTSIQFNNCEGGITNQNGNLTCTHRIKPVKPPPKGSYKQSCEDTSVDGKWLNAKCQRVNGNWNNSSIKYADCNKDIWNNNGVLTCGGGGGGGGSDLPKGSYKQTCKNAYVEGNVLEADCLNRNGKYAHTSTKYKNCSKGVWNDKGQLRCN